MARAVAFALTRIHAFPQTPDPSLSIQDRNQTIRARFEAGESQAAIARAFGISYQRVHQIVTGPKM